MNTTLLRRRSPGCHGRPTPSALLLNCSSWWTPWKTYLRGAPGRSAAQRGGGRVGVGVGVGGQVLMGGCFGVEVYYRGGGQVVGVSGYGWGDTHGRGYIERVAAHRRRCDGMGWVGWRAAKRSQTCPSSPLPP